MAEVQTVTGPVDTAQLGATLMHEHVFVLTPELQANFPPTLDEDAAVADAVERLRRLVALGIHAIADPTVVGLGRNIPLVRRVAEQVPELHIMAASGLYTFNELPHRYGMSGPGTLMGGEEPLVDLFAADVEEGIAGTGVKAAFFKCAIDRPGLTAGVERVLRAVARAHRRTGAPITVHTSVANHAALTAQQVFAEEGVDLSRVVVGHVGDSTDLDYLRQLADAGSLLGMDRFGIDAILPTSERVETVARLCEAGYADHMVLAHDASCVNDWFPAGALERLGPNWHFEHISNDVLPALRERGVTEEQIHTMLVANPRRYFENVRPY